jgi:hypothetical protein
MLRVETLILRIGKNRSARQKTCENLTLSVTIMLHVDIMENNCVHQAFGSVIKTRGFERGSSNNLLVEEKLRS